MALDLAWLASLHEAKRLRLVTGAGLQGVVHMNGDPEALVNELIRLAAVGQHCEAMAGDRPARRVASVVREAKS